MWIIQKKSITTKKSNYKHKSRRMRQFYEIVLECLPMSNRGLTSSKKQREVAQHLKKCILYIHHSHTATKPPQSPENPESFRLSNRQYGKALAKVKLHRGPENADCSVITLLALPVFPSFGLFCAASEGPRSPRSEHVCCLVTRAPLKCCSESCNGSDRCYCIDGGREKNEIGFGSPRGSPTLPSRCGNLRFLWAISRIEDCDLQYCEAVRERDIVLC